MLFYNFDMLDNFIKDNLMDNLKIEKENIKEIIDLYDYKKTSLLSITNNILDTADLIEKSKLQNFHENVSLLKKSFENIDAIQELASKLNQGIDFMISLYNKSLENNQDEIKANLVEYNKQRDELSYKILEFERMSTSILDSTLELSFTNLNKKTKKQKFKTSRAPKKDKIKIDIEQKPYDNNVLIISEKEQKAYLPFFYTEVKKIYENSNNNYMTLQDVVDDLYVIPLDKFKNSAIARFKESFHLIRNKEKDSITKALDLGLELMFQYELNPIIIAACRNLDELDIYLDCLAENELHDFSCFEIKFEVMPQLAKKGKKNTFLF